MTVKPVDRSLSPNHAKKASQLRWQGFINWRRGKVTEALRFYQQELELRWEVQIKENRAVHKGAPLNMIGFILLAKNELEISLFHFILAYIEDTLNVNFGYENDADLSTAARVLNDLFEINSQILTEIKKFVQEKKQVGLWETLSDPHKIFQEIGQTLSLNTNNLLSECSTIPTFNDAVTTLSSCMI